LIIDNTKKGEDKILNSFKRNVITIGFFVLIAMAIAIPPVTSEGKNVKTPSASKSLPRLVDIGAKQCIPCKMMAPVLEELKRDYAGILNVEFVDIWENPNAGQKYGIRAIPTQIFYNASGKELYRHMGFMSKEQILETFKVLGIELKKSSGQKK